MVNTHEGEAGYATASPLWFGPQDRRLQGWIHQPADGRARGGIVLCPPIGIELSYSQNAYRLLAQRLALGGFLVLRFDYDGTGQSAGELSDAGRVDAWLESIAAAAKLVRGLGVHWIGGVGLRLGATLLMSAATRGVEFDSVVLWDPCVTGKAFLREQRALHSAVRSSEDGTEASFEIPGYTLTKETVEDIRALEIAPAVASPACGLVLLDPARTAIVEDLRRRLAVSKLDWAEYADDTTPFDLGPIEWHPPRALVTQIAGWVDAACPDPLEPVRRPAIATRATVTRSESGPIVEEFVRLGPTGLFGIACNPTGSGDAGDARPTVLLLSIAADTSIGPARQWVELARYWATLGIRSIRFDLSGIGESPVRADCFERQIYARHALADICEAATAASPRDPTDVVLVGVCSGAYAALAVAPRLSPRGVVAINPHLTFDAYGSSIGAAAVSAGASQRGHQASRSTLLAPSADLVRAAGSRFRDTLPRWLWRLVYRLRLAHSPARLLEPAIRAGVPVLLISGSEEAHVPLQRTPHLLRRLDEAPSSSFGVVPDFQHSLLDAFSRDAVRTRVTEYLVSLTSAVRLGPARPRQAWRGEARAKVRNVTAWAAGRGGR
jgi:alpha-beta hydrolase superfamily lysophospholipase